MLYLGEPNPRAGWQTSCSMKGAMKYIVVLLVAGGVYVMLSHHAPVKPAATSQTDAATPGTDWLKEPLDRTHEVLDQAKTRTKDPALQ